MFDDENVSKDADDDNQAESDDSQCGDFIDEDEEEISNESDASGEEEEEEDLEKGGNEDEQTPDDMKNIQEKVKLEPKKRVFGDLNVSDISHLKAYFRKTLFQSLKFVTKNITRHNSTQMEECYKITKCKKDATMRANKHQGIVKLMEHCLMSKRNYIVGCLEEKNLGMFSILS